MCRLLAWTGTAPRSAAEALQPTATEQFVALGDVHRDGWGMAWWPPTGHTEADGPAAVHSTAAGGSDPALRAALNDTASCGGLVHLRWATPGLPVVPANCHPFVRGRYAMAHNGGIYPLDRIGEILPPEAEATAAGTTDSERYFLAMAAALAEGRPLVEVVAQVVGRLFTGWSPTSLNAVLLTPDALAVICAYDPSVPTPVLGSADDYYRLRYRHDDTGVVVASSGFGQEDTNGWADVGNRTVLVAPLDGGAPVLHPLDVQLPQRTAEDVAGGAELR